MKKKLLTLMMVVIAIACALTSCLVGQKAPVSIEVNKDTIKTEYKLNETPDFSGIKVTVKYNDGTSTEISADDADLKIGTVDTTTEGTKKLTITYKEVSVNIDVTVKGEIVVTPPVDEKPEDEKPEDEKPEDEKPGIIIMGAELPANLNSLKGKKAAFRDGTQLYNVGDDNAYILKLNVTAIDENDEEVFGIDYLGASVVYLVEGDNKTLLAGEDIATYVVIDETLHTFDFTEAAIGKTFEIQTRPAQNLGIEEQDAICTQTVVVVDGYNVYNAKELNLLTNDPDATFGNDDEFVQVDIVNAFLAANGIVRPEKMAGMVIHNDIVLTKDDIPAGYITPADAGTAAGYLYDFMMIYRHAVTKDTPTFSFYGNYYTIDSKNLPNVPPQDDAYNGDGISNTVLFMFSVDRAITDTRNSDGSPVNPAVEADAYKNYNPNDYVTNVYNLAMRDNEPNSNMTGDEFLDAAKRGLIGFKTRFHTVNINNTRVEAYMLSLITDYDHQIVNLNKVDFYNAWQNHIFASAKNLLWERNNAEDVEPTEVYYQPTINIVDSRVAKCGGPVIISQTDGLDRVSCSKSASIINIDSATEIYSYVNGTEPWFQAYKVTDIATLIVSLSAHIENVGKMAGLNAGFLTNVNGNVAMNLIMANMPAGMSLTLGGDDVDGKLTIGDKVVMNMNDGENPMVDKYIQTLLALTNQMAPVFQTTAGGTCASDGTSSIFGIETGAPGAPTAECFAGDYITLYYNGISVSFKYYVSPLAQ